MKTQQTQDAALRPEWTGRRVSSRLLPGRSEPTDSDAGQTDVSVDPARRNDRTRTFLPATATATATSLNHAPAGSPAASPTTALSRLHSRPTVPVPRSSRGPIASHQPRTGWLSSRSRRQRRYDFTAGRRSRFRFVPRTVRHSLLLLPTTATSSSADVPWFLSRSANQRSTVRSSGNSSCWNRSSQQPAAAALTMRSYTSPHRVSQTQRYHLAHTVEPNSTRLFTRLPHATNTSVLEHGLEPTVVSCEIFSQAH